MADERNAEIVNEPRKYTARQVFESATEWAGAKLRGALDADGNDINNVGALTTEEALNSSIGDGVDYLDPTWLVETDYVYWHVHGNASWNPQPNSTGSGNVEGDQGGFYRITTGGTSGGTAEARWRNSENPDFSKHSRFKDTVGFRDVGDAIHYATAGDVAGGNAGYGFKVVGVSGTPTLQGVVHDGTSETTTDLVSGISPAYTPGLRARFYPGDRVEFEVIEADVTGEITSGVPSSGSSYYHHHVENTADSEKRMHIRSIKFFEGL